MRAVPASASALRPDASPRQPAWPGAQRWRRWVPPLLLLFLAILPYLTSLSNGFVYDDDTQILANPYLQNFSHLKAIFTTTAWSYQGGAAGVTNYYRPLMTFGYLLIHQAFGYRPLFFHLANILANAAVVLLLFFLTLKMYEDRILAFVAAALFALHPIHSEPVNWIAAITDLELTFFFLLAFWFFISLSRTPVRRWWIAQCGLILSFALCLLSKEQAMMLPVVATVYEHLYRQDRCETGLGEKVSRYGALWLMAAGYLIFRIRVLGGFAPIGQKKTYSTDEVIFYAAGLVGQYLKKVIWPVHLHVYYAFPSTLGEWMPQMLGGLLALALFAVVFSVLWRVVRPVSFGCVWFALTLAPVLDVGLLPNSIFGERYLYLPSVGFCWVVAWGAARLWEKGPQCGKAWRKAMVAAAGVIAVLGAMRIVTQNRAWKDDLTFDQAALANAPNSGDVHNNLGVLYWNRGNWTLAEQEWRKAHQLEPGAVYVLDNLGLLCNREKRYGEAEYYLQKALVLSPHDVNALVNSGQTEKYLGNRDAAEAKLREAVALAPLSVRARIGWGELLLDEGQAANAVSQFLAANQSQPTPRANYGLGLAEWAQGDRRQAERAFQNALSLNPADSRAHFLLGLLYENWGRTQDALEQYRAGLRTDASNPTALAAVRRLTGQRPPAPAKKKKSN